VIASHDVYASDALHVATYSSVARVKRLDGMLSDDRHFRRLGQIVNVLALSEVSSGAVESYRARGEDALPREA